MNCLDGILEGLDIATFASIETRAKPCEELWQGIDNVVTNVKHAVEIYKRTGVAPECKLENWETSLVFEDALQQLSLKENVRPYENAPTENKGCSRRNTRQAAQNYIKKEKLSLLQLTSAEMPAPTKPVPKRTKQKQQASQLCIKEEMLESQDSVIIQDIEIPMVDLLDSDDNERSEEMPNPIRQSSRKTRQKIGENIVIKKEKSSKIMPQDTTMTVVNLPESDNEQEAVNKTEVKPKLQNKVKVKKEKIGEKPMNKVQDMTMIVVNLVNSIGGEEKNTKGSASKTRSKEIKKRARIDSLSDSDEQNNEKKSKSDSDNLGDLSPHPINDATFVSNPGISITPNAMNTTMIMKNPKFSNNKLVENVGAINKTETKVPVPNNKSEGTGAKKKIQSSLESTKTSRTKATGKVKEAVDATPKICTPGIPKLISRPATATAKKATRTPQSSSNSKPMAPKYASELKASQAEYREREKRREKEKGALVSVQVQLEERQRKFEEKQARLQQRDACDKEKQLQKRMPKMKVLEEQKRQEKPKRKEEKKQPIYMTMKPPFLPTEDCYDSDDEERPKRTLKEPSWAKSGYLKETMFCLLAAGETIKNTFFSRQVETPDLLEIFEIIESEKLKRSSSAIWHKPPRYTMMPVLDQHFENSDEDED